MFLTYTVTWLTFFVYPAIGIKIPEAYVITPGILVLNGGINSIIYLVLNKEVNIQTVFCDVTIGVGFAELLLQYRPKE